VGYGEEIVRFRRAEAKLGAALQVARAKNLSPALWKTAEVLQQTCVKEREVVERDNRSIYREVVPNDPDLPDLGTSSYQGCGYSCLCPTLAASAIS